MIERKVISQPFETIALDLVGLVPKGKGGANFILMAVCMATRCLEAVPLKSITAKAVANTTLDILAEWDYHIKYSRIEAPNLLGPFPNTYMLC